MTFTDEFPGLVDHQWDFNYTDYYRFNNENTVKNYTKGEGEFIIASDEPDEWGSECGGIFIKRADVRKHCLDKQRVREEIKKVQDIYSHDIFPDDFYEELIKSVCGQIMVNLNLEDDDD